MRVNIVAATKPQPFFREFWPGPLPRSRLHVCRAQTQQRLSRSPFCRPRSPGRRCRRRQSERQRNGRVVLTFLSPFLRSIICGRRRSPVVISRFPLNYRAERRAGGRGVQSVDLIDTSSERALKQSAEGRGTRPPGRPRLDGKCPSESGRAVRGWEREAGKRGQLEVIILTN